MKVLLINSMSDYVKEISVMPLGLLSIATHLTQNGHTVQIYDRTIERGSVNKNLESFAPDIVGISAISSKSFADSVKVSKIVKKKNIPVVWGGLTTSLLPEIVLESGVVDYVVIGEGEITLLELINAIVKKTSLREVDGLAFIENGEIIINNEREPAELSRLPIIDFSFIDPRKYIVTNVNNKRVLHTYTSKGCPCQCTYCYNPAFCKGLWRTRPPEYFLSEIKYLIEQFNIDCIYFIDDLLSCNKEYTIHLCNKIIESGLGFVWGCDMRADICTKEELLIMYKAGCRWIFFGIESGSERMQKIIKKRLNLEKAKETINFCTEIGIVTTTSFIAGFPDETEEDLIETIEFAQGLNSEVKIAFSFGPIPKSEIYENLIESKKLSSPKSYKEFINLKWFDSFGKNYSKVPTKDFKVIISYFFLSIISKKHKVDNSKKRIWFKRLFKQAFYIIKRGNMKALFSVLLCVKELFEIEFYATMFPKIRKKYGLTYNRKKTK